MVEDSWGAESWQPSRLLRVSAPLAYASASLVGIYLWGIPASTDRVMLLLVGGLLSCSLLDLRRPRRILFEWLPLTALLIFYDLLRGHADGLLTRAHVLPQIWISEQLGRGTVPVVWLQRKLWHGAGDLRWYDYACFAVYVSHFLVTPVLAAMLWLRRPRLFRRYGSMVLVLAFLGVTTYALFPAVPPWLASDHHLLPPITRLITLISQHVPVNGPLFESGAGYANAVAAIPSLHAAFALLAALALGAQTRRRLLRAGLMLYPLAMGFTLVYTGEHYTIDVLLGWLYAAAAYRIVRLAEDRVASRSVRSLGRTTSRDGSAVPAG